MEEHDPTQNYLSLVKNRMFDAFQFGFLLDGREISEVDEAAVASRSIAYWDVLAQFSIAQLTRQS